MPAPTLNEILLILSGHGITMPQVESAMGDWIDRRIDNRIEEKEKGEIMGMPELLEHLKPYRITRSSVDKWVMNAKRKLCSFPFHKAGRKLHFYKTEIDCWLHSCR